MPETRRRALTALPLPKLPEESASLAMEIESDHMDHYSMAAGTSLAEPMSPQSASERKGGLNSTILTTATPKLVFSPPGPARSRSAVQHQIYLNHAKAKVVGSPATDFFAKHEITEKLRARMLDWMIEVLKIYQQSDETLFRAIALMDGYLAATPACVRPGDLHILGSTCMFLASKQEEVRPIKLSALVADICKDKLPADAILAKELEVMGALGFRSQRPDLFALMRCALNVLGIEESAVFSFVENITVLIAKMALFFREVVARFGVADIAAAILIMALKLAESVHPGFCAAPHIQRVVAEFGVDETFLMGAIFLMNKSLLAFEQTFPYVRNVEAFHKFAG